MDESVEEEAVVLAPSEDVEGDIEVEFSFTMPMTEDVTRRVLFGFASADDLHVDDPVSGDYGVSGEYNMYRFQEVEHAFGMLFYFAELGEFDEEEFRREMRETSEAVEQGLEVFDEWQSSLSFRDRRLRLVELVERSHNPIHEQALEEGEFRREESDYDVKGMSKLMERVDFHPQKCYLNALKLLSYSGFPEELEYCEGLFLPEQAVRVVNHAWVEADGVPIEVTLPWHDVDGTANEGVYYGRVVSRNEVEEAIEEVEGDGVLKPPLTISEELREKLVSSPGGPSF